MTRSNIFGEIPCNICGFNEGMSSANMVHICGDCRGDMKPVALTVKQMREYFDPSYNPKQEKPNT